MTSRPALVRALIAVPVIVFLAGSATAGPLQSDAERLCFHYPQDAWAAASDPTILPVDRSGDDDCPALCDKWVALCKGVVKVRKRCWTAAAAQVTRVRKAECNSLADATARAACMDDLKAEKGDLKRYLAIASDIGATYCEQNGAAACTLHCD